MLESTHNFFEPWFCFKENDCLNDTSDDVENTSMLIRISTRTLFLETFYLGYEMIEFVVNKLKPPLGEYIESDDFIKALNIIDSVYSLKEIDFPRIINILIF